MTREQVFEYKKWLKEKGLPFLLFPDWVIEFKKEKGIK